MDKIKIVTEGMITRLCSQSIHRNPNLSFLFIVDSLVSDMEECNLILALILPTVLLNELNESNLCNSCIMSGRSTQSHKSCRQVVVVCLSAYYSANKKWLLLIKLNSNADIFSKPKVIIQSCPLTGKQLPTNRQTYQPIV